MKLIELGIDPDDIDPVTNDKVGNEGLEDDTLGFPSKIESNKILRFILDEKDIYPFEEERRLFYVALTRTKNYVYLMVDKNNQSIFVDEIIRNNKKNIYFYKI